jgi:hypothetical protein
MTHQSAIELMKSSKSVQEWNSNRELVKDAFPHKTEDELRKSPLLFIDGSGLISKILRNVSKS